MALPQNSIDSEFHRLLVEGAPDLIARLNPDGVFTYASPAARDLTGFDSGELLGRSLCSLLPYSLDSDRVRKSFNTLKTQSSAQTVDYRLRRKDGGYVWLETTFKPVRDPETKTLYEVMAFSHNVTKAKQIETALQFLSRGSDALTFDDFFRPLVSHVAAALQVNYAFITEAIEDHTKVRMLAFWKGEDFADPFEYGLADTPCDSVINEGKMCYYPLGIQGIFPKDQDLVSLNAQGYVGIPIGDLAGKVIGHLAILDRKPIKLDDPQLWILKLFAARAGTELERLRMNGKSYQS